jgi:serine/threonine protein kinase
MFARGDKIRDYEIIAPLRSGGMAMLYLARRRGVGGFSRLVALKLVHSHLAVDAGINRLFLREARLAASVAHPNVVNVEEVGEADGNYFIAMEYVHGVSLAELLASLQKRRLRMSSKLAVWIAAHVAEALHAAHEARNEAGLPLHIVHRDVSPQNVLIGHTGHVKLIDFGIAKSPHIGRHATGAGAVLGKLGYMAPEQLRGDAVDRRTDVYALGVMVWEMLTSRSLLRAVHIGDDQDWATRQSPPPPRSHSPLVAPALDRVVIKALAFDAGDRYGSALEFRSVLLQAEPAAAEVDAPRLAALMRSLLADELERQRAGWPSEVNAELGVDTGLTTRAVNIDELTTKLRSADGPDDDDGMGSEEPTTVMDVSSAQRLRRSAELIAELPAGTLTPRCAIETPRLGLSAAPLALAPASALARRQTLHAVALSVMCVGFGMLPAAPASEPHTRARLEIGVISSIVPGGPAPALAERVKPPAANGGTGSMSARLACVSAEVAGGDLFAPVEPERAVDSTTALSAAGTDEIVCHDGSNEEPRVTRSIWDASAPAAGHGKSRRSRRHAD